MAARIRNITFDCDDVLKMAAFWSAVLPSAAHSTRGSNELFATIGGADAKRRAGVVLQQGAPTEASQEPRVPRSGEPGPSALDELVGHGATVVGEHQLPGGTHRWTVMQDPEGNEFCIAAKASPAGG